MNFVPFRRYHGLDNDRKHHRLYLKLSSTDKHSYHSKWTRDGRTWPAIKPRHKVPPEEQTKHERWERRGVLNSDSQTQETPLIDRRILNDKIHF